jgi:hypothetical protein
MGLNYPEWIIAISTATLVAATLVLSWMTGLLWKEAQRTSQLAQRANINCAVEPHQTRPNVVELVVANSGAAPAFDVKIRIKGARTNGRDKDQNPFFWSCVLPDARFRIFIGTGDELLERSIEVDLSFRDEFGAQVRLLRQDMSGWTGYSFFPPA